jgi:hypothetical protein
LGWVENLSYRNGGGVVVELLVPVVVKAGAAAGGGGQNDRRRVHRVRALIPACLHHPSLSGCLPIFFTVENRIPSFMD